MSLVALIMQAAEQLPPPTDNLPVAEPEKIPASQAVQRVEAGTLTSIFELNLTVIILVFGLLALVLLYLMIRSDRAGPFELRIYVITILVFGSLLIVSSAFTTEQIAPVIGFFGTIAGYILGRGDKNDIPQPSPEPQPQPQPQPQPPME